MNPENICPEIFEPLHQSVIGTDGSNIVFMNSYAKEILKKDLTGSPADIVFPEEALKNASDKFMCAADIMGMKATMSAVRSGTLLIFYIDFPKPESCGLCITPHFISSLRNSAMGIKMSADRCFSMLEDGKTPSDKHISVLYHYYYSLTRSLTQADTANHLERGELPFFPVLTDMVRLCSDLTDTIANLCRDNGIDIRFQTTEIQAFAVVDPAKIEQLLLNLFSNSIKHCSKGSTISLTLKLSGNRLVLLMDDTGSGIPQHLLSRLFSVQENDYDIKNPQSGIGLGMYISYGIVHLHNGVLLIESREGEGTHIGIMFPTDNPSNTVFKTPEVSYRHSGASNVLIELSDVLKSNCFGPKYED